MTGEGWGPVGRPDGDGAEPAQVAGSASGLPTRSVGAPGVLELPDGIEIPDTADPELDAALRALAAASAVPVEDQIPVIEAVHRALQDRLADTEG